MQRSAGFTIIELTLVIALIAVIASFGAAMTLSSLSKSVVTQERDLFVTLLLRGTRAAALANLNESPHAIYIDNANHQYVQFEGTTYDENGASNREIPFSSDAVTVNNSGGDTIVFDQLSGNVSEGAGTITIQNSAATAEITISSVGQIDW